MLKVDVFIYMDVPSADSSVSFYFLPLLSLLVVCIKFVGNSSVDYYQFIYLVEHACIAPLVCTNKFVSMTRWKRKRKYQTRWNEILLDHIRGKPHVIIAKFLLPLAYIQKSVLCFYCLWLLSVHSFLIILFHFLLFCARLV